MKATKFLAWVVVLALLASLSGAVSAGEPKQASNGGCVAGDVYDPVCDVNRNGRIDIVDLMIVQTHWNQKGTWTGDGGYWTQTASAQSRGDPWSPSTQQDASLEPMAGLGGVPRWTPLGEPLAPGGQVLGLAVHPTTPETVYAAVAPVEAYDSGPSTLYKTTDGAASWTEVYLAEHQVYALAAAGDNVYAGAFNPGGDGPGIYVSNDGGATWATTFEFSSRGVWSDISVHPSDPDVAIIGGWGPPPDQSGLVYKASYDGGLVYKTDDGGQTWSPSLSATFPDSNGSVDAVLIHPISPTLMLASAHAENSNDCDVQRSEDGGASWTEASTIVGAQVKSFVGHPTAPRIIYAGTGGSAFTGGPHKVFRSSDAGQSWSEVFDEGGGLLAFEPPSTIYAAARGGEVWSSASNGDPGTWNAVGGVPDALSFAIDLGATPVALYAGAARDGVFKSTNGAGDWEERNNGIETPVQPRDIDVDPQNLDKIFTAAECGGGWLTTDGGDSWIEPQGISGCMGAFAVNPANPSIVYGGGLDDSNGAVMRSEDGGVSFERVYTAPYIEPDGSGGGQQIRALAIADSATDTVYAAGQNNPADQDDYGIVLRTPDDGESWTQALTLPGESRVDAIAVSPANADVAYAGGEDCSGPGCVGFVRRTEDGGDNWTLVFEEPDSRVRSIVVDHQDPDVVYATANYDVYKSMDAGDTWTLIRSCCPSGDLLAMDPHDSSHVYLGGWGYIAETWDGGATWSEWDDPINNGTPGMQPGALTVDTGEVVQSMYAGFSGVWRYSRLLPGEGDRYVATSGSDDLNVCLDPAVPCLTIGHAIQVANPGESIFVAQGTYTENPNVSKPLSLLGGYEASGWTRDIAAYETIVDGNQNGTVVTLQGGSEGAVLDGFTITGGSGEEAGGVEADHGGITIRSCSIQNNMADGSPHHSGGGGVKGNDLTIVDSRIINNEVQSGASGVRVGEGHLAMVNTIVADNLGDEGLHLNGSASLMNVTIAGNAPGTGRPGINYNPQTGGTMEVVNSIIYGNGSGDAFHVEDPDTIQVTYSDIEGGWPGTGNIDAAPLFVDAGSGDYHLQVGSPCIDAGTAVSAPATDLEGTPRDATPDMGAYEWRFRIFLPLALRNFGP